jgi:hypothetical protein
MYDAAFMLRLALQLVALLFTAFPWVASVGPGRARAEASLSSPHAPAQILQPAIPDSTGPNPIGLLAMRGPGEVLGLRQSLEAAAPEAVVAVRAERRWLRFSRLQLDGG